MITRQAGRSFSIDDIPQSLVNLYSERSKEIRKYMAEHNLTGPAAAAEAALKTREKKDFWVSRKRLFDMWHPINEAHGFNERSIQDLLRHGPRKPTGSFKKVLREVLDELTFRKNHFSKREFLLETLWKLPNYGLDPDPVFEEVDRFLTQSPNIVSLGVVDDDQRFTTKQILSEEQRLLAALDKLAKRPGLQASDRNLNEQLKKRPTIREEQAEFAKYMSQQKSAFRIGRGLAGSGKTFAIKTHTDAMQAQGCRVLGASPTGQGARVLSDQIRIQCRTLTRLLGDYHLPTSAIVGHHMWQFWRALPRKTHLAIAPAKACPHRFQHGSAGGRSGNGRYIRHEETRGVGRASRLRYASSETRSNSRP